MPCENSSCVNLSKCVPIPDSAAAVHSAAKATINNYPIASQYLAIWPTVCMGGCEQEGGKDTQVMMRRRSSTPRLRRITVRV